jgi:hypothetical protein
MAERFLNTLQQMPPMAIMFLVVGAWIYLTVLLSALTSIGQKWYQGIIGEIEKRERAKRAARFDKCLKRAPSSIGLEQLTLNQQVPGSIPGGLTKKKEYDVRRRISWFLDTRTAIAMSDGDVLPTKFQWRDLPRPKLTEFGMSSPSDTRHGVSRDFKEDEHKVQLLWDGTTCETFVDEVTLKRFIISFVYMIPTADLIPSELLADANLVYKDDWVDEWGCQDRNDEIIECPRDIYRPGARKIQLDAGFSTRRSGKQQNAKPRIYSKSGLTIIPARIEIPDEKCFYSFRAGGFYEKGQKPLESTCEKGEKAV